MGKVKVVPAVKLIIGFIFNDEAYFTKACPYLKRHFGEIDFESKTLAFDYTDYYLKEFGPDLKRKFVSFKKLINPEQLSEIKILTNKIEDRLSVNQNRKINLDPGYLDMARLVLATTKDFAHRIYLKKGIFAELTLNYQDKMFKPHPWTYPDYKTPEYYAIFNQIRDIYARQILRKD